MQDDKKNLTQRTVRENYLELEYWTPEEAANWAGLSYQTVRRKMTTTRDGQYLFKRGLKCGPFIVDRDSFVEYCTGGEAVGELI